MNYSLGSIEIANHTGATLPALATAEHLSTLAADAVYVHVNEVASFDARAHWDARVHVRYAPARADYVIRKNKTGLPA